MNKKKGIENLVLDEVLGDLNPEESLPKEEPVNESLGDVTMIGDLLTDSSPQEKEEKVIPFPQGELPGDEKTDPEGLSLDPSLLEEAEVLEEVPEKKQTPPSVDDGQIDALKEEISKIKEELSEARDEVSKKKEEIESLKSNSPSPNTSSSDVDYKMEIVRSEKQALLKSKDEMILTLKKEVDRKEKDLERYRDKIKELNESSKKKQDLLERSFKAVKMIEQLLKKNI